MAKIKPLPNGRSGSKTRGFSLVPLEMQESEAYLSLTASALKVLTRCLWKGYQAGSNQPRGASGPPAFRFTNTEAEEKLGMNQTTFTRAKNELDKKGFIRWVVRGGLRGVNGVASEFCLSGDWKGWSKKGCIPKEKNHPPWQES